MNILPRSLVIWVAFVLLCITANGAAQNSETSTSPVVRVELNDGLLTLAARSAPLHEVMREIGELAGFETVLVGSFTEPQLVSASFEDLPVREAVERLVGAENRIIVYAPSAGDAGTRAITQVLLLQAGTTPTDMTFAEEQSIASGREEDVRAYKLARLTAMLQPGQAEVVRTRAAMALGRFQDERAVIALASALSDDVPAVRLQAINALGRIGSEQASEALTNFLRDDNKDAAERKTAIRALSLHDTETARNFLHSGGNTSD